MGHKKHKKESKKKKQRSRSRSPLLVDGELREPPRERKKHHKKHKNKKRDLSPDIEEVPVDSHIALAAAHEGSDNDTSRSARSASATRDRSHRAERALDRELEEYAVRGVAREPSPVSGGGSHQESLSIQETNRIRAKLGLKPLEVAEKTADDGKIKDDLGEFYHKPATNITKDKKTERLKEKLQERQEKRKMEQRLKTTLLAEDGEDDDAAAWVLKSRELAKQKAEAAKRAAILDELDAEFGVSALVAEEQRSDAAQSYSANSLRGLRVAHDVTQLAEERAVIMTLADRPVLAEDEDVLVNVNMLDDERYKKNLLEKKKARAGYQAYEDADDIEAAALGLQKGVLSKYDEEIDKVSAAKKQGFVIGDEDGLEAQRFREAMIRARFEGGPSRRLESLALPPLRPATDYLTEQEMSAKFNKSKRKGKIRKKAKVEPIDVDNYNPDLAPLDVDDTDVKASETQAGSEEEEVEVDSELQAALARARRLRQAPPPTATVTKMEDLVKAKEEPLEEETMPSGGMVLDATAEFCRTLGDIPTYGQAGNRDQNTEIMDFDEAEEPDKIERGGAWNRVDIDSEKVPDITATEADVGLEAEPALDGGVAGALRLALSKGYLEKAAPGPARAPPNAHLLHAAHYSIDDKAHHGEDDKYGRRERGGYCGPLQDFREKSGFKPNIKLEYVDDHGLPLCPKEAFRYLSHKFHGKGPSKNKQEKRLKKSVQEGLMKKMSSTDTPLNTLALLQEKQKETHSPYIVLSGAKKDNVQH